MSEFTSRSLTELALRAFARHGLSLPHGQGVRTAQAHLPLLTKRALLEQALEQLGVDAILAVGQEVSQVHDDPILSVLRRARSPHDLVERWQRLEGYFHIRHRVRVLTTGPRQLVLEHHALRGPPPTLPEDLLMAGLLAGLLMDAGGRGVHAGLGARGQRRFVHDDRFTGLDTGGAGTQRPLRSAARWRLCWQSFAAPRRTASGPGEPHQDLPGAPSLEHRLAALLRSDPARHWRLEAAAADLGLTARTLQRKLAQEGTCFGDLLRSVRARGAARLVEQGIPLAEAGFACGYADQAHFSREFAACIGLPPGRFRAGLA